MTPYRSILIRCLLLFSILLSISLLAQTPEIERLTEALAQQQGAEKLNTYSELSFHYYRTDPTKGLYYGRKALELADSLGLSAAKSKACNNIGINYYVLAKYDSAQIYLEKALQYAIQFNDTLQKADAFNRLGVVYEKKPKLDSALYAFHEALKLYKQLGNNERAGVASENIGTIHLHRGEETSALTWLLEAKALFEAADARHRLPSAYVRLGRIYSEDGNFTEAEKWFLRTIELAAEQENHNIQGIAINALGIMYKNQGRYEEAVEKYLDAVAFSEKIRNPHLLSAIYGNIGNAYARLGDHKNALDYHRLTLGVAQNLNMPLQVAIAQANMGSAYNSLGDYSSAKAYFEKALPVFIDTGTWSMLLSAYRGLIRANTGLNSYKDAVEYFQEYVTIKDSLNRVERNSALDSLKVMFQTEQITMEAKLLEQSNEIQAKTIARQQQIMLSAIIASLLLTVFIVVVMRNRRTIELANALLASKNSEISAKAEELSEINKKMQEHAQFKERMNAFLVHDLKNPLNAIININEFTHEQTEIIKQSGFLMLNIVSNLLDVQKYEHSTMQLSVEDASLTQIIHRAFSEVSYLTKEKSIQMSLDLQSDFMLQVDPDVVKRVIVNIFTNAIKFSDTCGEIRILAQKGGSAEAKVTIEDDGEGVSPDYLPFVFDKFSQGAPRSSGYATSTGVGLTFCKMAVEAHGGKIGVASGKERGASFWFTLPLSQIQHKATEVTQILSICADLFDNLRLTASEKAYLLPFCEKLKKISVYHLTDVKEVVKAIEGRSENILVWKTLVMKALAACNEPKYHQVINLCYDEPV